MPQEDRIYSTGREAIESLREDYRDFNDDPDESFEEFAGDTPTIRRSGRVQSNVCRSQTVRNCWGCAASPARSS